MHFLFFMHIFLSEEHSLLIHITIFICSQLELMLTRGCFGVLQLLLQLVKVILSFLTCFSRLVHLNQLVKMLCLKLAFGVGPSLQNSWSVQRWQRQQILCSWQIQVHVGYSSYQFQFGSYLFSNYPLLCKEWSGCKSCEQSPLAFVQASIAC